MNFPAVAKDWKKFEANNKKIAFNVLSSSNIGEETKQAYISKCNSNHEKQLIILIINYFTGGEKWHYLAVKNLSVLLRGVTSKNNVEFY